MKTIRELLQEGDPLRHEQPPSLSQRDIRRQAILAEAAGVREPGGTAGRSRIAVIAAATFVVLAATVLGVLVWSMFNRDLQAAMRFEVRLAEDKPAPGLREEKVADSDRSIYLHGEVVVTNNDIASVRAIPQGNDPSKYAISVEFNKSGSEKMREATANNIGKLMAIILDGQVVIAPVVKSPVGANALITGKMTQTEAESMAKRIAKGIGIQ